MSTRNEKAPDLASILSGIVDKCDTPIVCAWMADGLLETVEALLSKGAAEEGEHQAAMEDAEKKVVAVRQVVCRVAWGDGT